ncbi:MAG: hypothetical protein JNG84_08505 [Archangium sp.]|nr:hypothetical protein [Archangium sp.]
MCTRTLLLVLAMASACMPSVADLSTRVYACKLDGECNDGRCIDGTCVAAGSDALRVTFAPQSGPAGTVLSIECSAVTNATGFVVGGTPALLLSRTGTTARVMVMPGTRSGPVGVLTRTGSLTSPNDFIHSAEAPPTLVRGARLPAPQGVSEQAGFGRALALDAEGRTLVSSTQLDTVTGGSAWVYRRDASAWRQQGGALAASSSEMLRYFAAGVAIDSSGETVAVSGGSAANESGASIVFVRDGGAYQAASAPLVAYTNGYRYEGVSASLSADGRTLVHGIINSGSGAGAGLFSRGDDGGWNPQGTALRVGGNTGYGLRSLFAGLDFSGTVMLVTAWRDADGIAHGWVFENGWGDVTELVAADSTGVASSPYDVNRVGGALSGDGHTAVLLGMRNEEGLATSLWVFHADPQWAQLGSRIDAPLRTVEGKPAVAVSTEGTWLVVGGSNLAGDRGAVAVYARDGGSWGLVGAPLELPVAVNSVAISADGRSVVAGSDTADEYEGTVWVLAAP